MAEVHVVTGKSVTLECVAEGSPEPMIRWVRNGETISLLTNANIRVLDGGRRLQVQGQDKMCF